MIIAIIVCVIVYKKYNFNDFEKKIRLSNITEFTRDSKIKYAKYDSYKIENKDYKKISARSCRVLCKYTI